jgi:hypothetical protein
MAKQLTKTILSAPSPETMDAIHGEERAAALRQAGFEFDAKRRDLETKFEAALAALRSQYLTAVGEISTQTE